MLGRRDKLKRIEAEVVDLDTRHAGVLRRLEAATAGAEQAVLAQRHLLTAERVDAAAARRAADACRTAADHRAALEDAARALHAELEHARARLAAERDRRFREAAAAEIEARAERIVSAAARLDEAAAAFDAARETMVAVCRDDAERSLLGHGPEFALVAAAARRAGVLPRLPVAGTIAAESPDSPDDGTVAGRVAGEMRAKAMAIREGAALAVIPNPPQTVPTPPVAWKMVRLVLGRPAVYRQANGHRIEVQAGGVDLPEPIAATALNRGVAFEPGSLQGRQILGILKANPAARIEADGRGGFRANGVSGFARTDKAPSPPPADLGELPDVDRDGVYAEAAQ